MSAIVELEPNMLVVPVNDNTTLAEIRPVVERFTEINSNTVFDYRDKAGNKAARSHVAMLRKAKAPINDTHKRMTEEAKRFKDAVDKDRREILAMVEDMIAVHAEPLRVIEEEEKAEAERQRIEQEVSDCWDIAHEMNAMVDRQRELDRQAAEQARIAEEQAAEQRRMQIEAEKKEAAEKAAEEARLAEQARAARAIEEAKQREQTAKEDADRRVKEAEALAALEKKETEMRIAREKAEVEAKFKEEQDRIRIEEERCRADVENMKRVHWAILGAMEGMGISCDQGKALIVAIRNGEIPAVSIDYKWNNAA